MGNTDGTDSLINKPFVDFIQLGLHSGIYFSHNGFNDTAAKRDSFVRFQINRPFLVQVVQVVLLMGCDLPVVLRVQPDNNIITFGNSVNGCSNDFSQNTPVLGNFLLNNLPGNEDGKLEQIFLAIPEKPPAQIEYLGHPPAQSLEDIVQASLRLSLAFFNTPGKGFLDPLQQLIFGN